MSMKQYQPLVKNAEHVLVGVAQIRVGKPSLRAVGTAAVGAMQRVTQSDLVTDTTDGVTKIVKPTSTLSTGTITSSSTSGTYTGALDGAFILRYNGATFDIFAPDGSMDAGVDAATLGTGYALNLEGGPSGLTLTTVIGTPAEKDSFIVPVWSGLAQDKVQTGIVTPYSPFRGSNESIGAVQSATFSPKVDSVATLEAGFPSEVFDRIVTKTSVTVSFEAMEYKNDNISHLKEMVSQIINESKIGAVPVEVVMRTRGNQLVTFWIPNCTVENLPEIAPQNDFSSLSWELAGSKMTEVSGASDTYNAWLRNAYLYRELEYIH